MTLMQRLARWGRRLLGLQIVLFIWVYVLVHVQMMDEGKLHEATITFIRGVEPEGAFGDKIESIADALDANPLVKARVVGHTGAGGDEAANLDLSRQRADLVYGRLIKAGVLPGRLVMEYVGSAEPTDRKDGESDAEWRRRQSRVDIYLSR